MCMVITRRTQDARGLDATIAWIYWMLVASSSTSMLLTTNYSLHNSSLRLDLNPSCAHQAFRILAAGAKSLPTCVLRTNSTRADRYMNTISMCSFVSCPGRFYIPFFRSLLYYYYYFRQWYAIFLCECKWVHCFTFFLFWSLCRSIRCSPHMWYACASKQIYAHGAIDHRMYGAVVHF